MGRILVCGEAWGKEEELARRPFVGKTGMLMNYMFEEAGLIPAGSARLINRDLYSKLYRKQAETYERADIYLTNVFNIHPHGNRIPSLCQKDRVDERPGIRNGQYLRREHYHHLERLQTEISNVKPNVIIGLGATASWFLLGSGAITKLRGACAETPYGKVLPTFHPAYLMRGAWEFRPVVILDLVKARNESEYPEIRRPPRFIYVPERIDDILWAQREMAGHQIAIDIETVDNQITCIGFAWTPEHVLVIPIFDWRQENKSYWGKTEEPLIWSMIRQLCQSPEPKIFQNGLFDLHFLWRTYGITVNNCTDDTMLLHHALYPEMLKGLGFLGSIYTTESSWKLMRAKGKHTLKDDKEE